MDDTMDMPHFDPRRIALGDALAALPMPAPERSAWPAMAARLQARSRAPRRWPFAIAAGLLALALLPRGGTGLGAPATDADTAAANASAQRQQLAALMAESARLERLVDAARDGGSTSAAAAAVSLSLEDRLRGVDAQLASTGAADASQQLTLWQQRVDLMRDVAAIEASRHYLASQGDSLDVALVAAY